jgi:hypothetical protein
VYGGESVALVRNGPSFSIHTQWRLDPSGGCHRGFVGGACSEREAGGVLLVGIGSEGIWSGGAWKVEGFCKSGPVAWGSCV